MSDQDFRPGKKVIVAAVTTVAATYAYFLLFAQFGFLKALQIATGGAQGVIKPVLTIMGGAGIFGSVLAAFIFTPERGRRVLVAGFALCAAAAGVSLVGSPGVIYDLVALMVGLGVGLTTVTLAGLLKRAVGDRWLGAFIGLGTGLAYGFCNLPAVFNATAAAQAELSGLIAGVGVLAATGLELGAIVVTPGDFDYSNRGVMTWVLIFSTLVGLDSAAFYIIQHTPSLKTETWTGESQLMINAGVHFTAALVAGIAFDRRWIGRTVLVAVILLVAACLLIDGVHPLFGGGALLYAAAVSVYSVALVFYAVRGMRPGLAALVYAVAGWGGSALGIGFAENRHIVPNRFIFVAGLVMVAALLVRSILSKRSVSGLATGVVMLASLIAATKSSAQDSALITRGREVFINEGCIHCHSQYVRPGTSDEERWGPVQSVESVMAQTPPLVGNRRQGPDLQNIGNRRNSEWNRLHLVAPRSITPGSRMPSYAYLFESGRSDGPALLAYLDSLGGDTTVDRWTANQSWEPQGDRPVRTLDQQRQLFVQWCSACHGVSGRGDGSAAALLTTRPRNLVEDAWRRVPPGSEAAAERLALARLIKFGVTDTAMAGREYLSDDTILSLVAYLQTLHVKK